MGSSIKKTNLFYLLLKSTPNICFILLMSCAIMLQPSSPEQYWKKKKKKKKLGADSSRAVSRSDSDVKRSG